MPARSSLVQCAEPLVPLAEPEGPVAASAIWNQSTGHQNLNDVWAFLRLGMRTEEGGAKLREHHYSEGATENAEEIRKDHHEVESYC